MSKVVDYLLNAAHSDGASKAKFFMSFGFDQRRPEQLLNALANHPNVNRMIDQTPGVFGVKSVVECNVASPDGRNPCIRTVWIREDEATPHRFVTAYPLT